MHSAASWLNMHPTRGHAFAIHLLLSVLIFSSLVAMMLIFWFPGDLFIMDGGWEGLKLVAMVDLVLGPALTLILFKPGKPGLKLDLSVIAALQIAALGYGFYTTYHQRTVAIVFADKEFATVSANSKKAADTQLADKQILSYALPSAKAFAVPQYLTMSDQSFAEYFQDILNGYPDAHHRSDMYVKLNEHSEKMRKYALSNGDLNEAGTLALVRDAAGKHRLSLEQVQIYKFRARYANGYALFDPKQARVIDFVRNRPNKTANTVAENASE